MKIVVKKYTKISNHIAKESIKVLFTFLLILLLFNSCKNEKVNNPEIEKSINQPQNDFDYKLRNEPKIFLKYWSEMTKDEASKVNDILINEGVIKQKPLDDGFTYYIDNYTVTMEFNYDLSNRLESISLKSNIDDIYPLYQKKYKLPNLVDCNTLIEYYLDNNNEYNPIYMYKKVGSDKNEFPIPNALLDKSSFVKSRIYYDIKNKKNNSNYITNKYYKDDLIVDKDSVIIAFTQEFDKETNEFCSYSLEKNKEAMAAQQNINGDGFGTLHYPGTGITDLIIMQNSKTITCRKYKVLKKSIKYMSKEKYKEKQQIINTATKKDSINKDIEGNIKKRRTEQSLNEI